MKNLGSTQKKLICTKSLAIFRVKNGGHRKSWGVIFSGYLALRGQKGKFPPKKFRFFFTKKMLNTHIYAKSGIVIIFASGATDRRYNQNTKKFGEKFQLGLTPHPHLIFKGMPFICYNRIKSRIQIQQS